MLFFRGFELCAWGGSDTAIYGFCLRSVRNGSDRRFVLPLKCLEFMAYSSLLCGLAEVWSC